MNYIKHLTTYFNKVTEDHSLNPTHISLYMAVFQFWNRNRFQNPMSISREEVMRISKIGSKATYHKCMRELHEKGYIIYEPSYNPFQGSKVQMINLYEEQKSIKKDNKTGSKNKPAIEQEVNKRQTSSETTTEQALVSSINNTNNANILNLDLTQKSTKSKEFKNQSSENNCHPELVEGITIPPNQESVKQFFKTESASEVEAEKFYNHYKSNGWLIGGKSKMKDWNAAARNWILNSKQFNATKSDLKPNHLNTSTQKNYGEPL